MSHGFGSPASIWASGRVWEHRRSNVRDRLIGVMLSTLSIVVYRMGSLVHACGRSQGAGDMGATQVQGGIYPSLTETPDYISRSVEMRGNEVTRGSWRGFLTSDRYRRMLMLIGRRSYRAYHKANEASVYLLVRMAKSAGRVGILRI